MIIKRGISMCVVLTVQICAHLSEKFGFNWWQQHVLILIPLLLHDFKNPYQQILLLQRLCIFCREVLIIDLATEVGTAPVWRRRQQQQWPPPKA